MKWMSSIARLSVLVFCLIAVHLSPAFAQDTGPKITSANATDLKLTRWLTRGSPSQVLWSPDSKIIVVASSVGVTLLDPLNPQTPLHIFNEYQGFIGNIAFSADGTKLAAGGRNATAYVWDVTSGQLLAALHDDADRDELNPERSAFIRSVAFSQDGTQLIAAAQNQTIRIWDISSRKESRVLKISRGRIDSLAVSQDLLASAAFDDYSGTVTIWNLKTGAILETWPYAGKLEFSHDGTKLVIDGNGVIAVVNVRTGNRLVSLGNTTDYALSSDGKTIAYTAFDEGPTKHQIHLWDIERGKRLNALTGHTAYAQAVAFSGDGSTLASTAYDGTVRLWNLQNDQQLALWQGYNAANYCGCDRSVHYRVVFSPDNQWLLMYSGGGDDQGIWLFDAKLQNKPIYLDLYSPFQESNGISITLSIPFTSDGATFAIVHGETVSLRDTTTNRIKMELNNPQNNALMSFKFSPDDHWFGATQLKNTLVVWDTTSGKEQSRLSADVHQAIQSFDFSPDGTLAALGTDRSSVEIRDIRSGAIVRTIVDQPKDNFPYQANFVQFTPDGGGIIIAWDGDAPELIDLKTGKVRIKFPDQTMVPLAFNHAGTQVAMLNRVIGVSVWDIASGKLVTTLPQELKLLFAISFSPDDKLLATGNYEGAVRVWDLSTSKMISFADLLGGTDSLAFSPDSKLLATASTDEQHASIRIWDLASATSLIQILSDGESIQYLAFSPDGTALLAASHDGGIREWTIAPQNSF